MKTPLCAAFFYTPEQTKMATFIRNKYIIILILSIFFAIWSIRPNEGKKLTITSTAPITQSPSTEPIDHPNASGKQAISAALPVLPPSLNGTEIDCPLEVDNMGKLVLNMGVRRCFDYFFSALGEKSEGQLIIDLRQYLAAKLPDTAQPYALTLLDKYLGYRHAQVPQALQTTSKSVDSLQTSLEALKILRLKYFTPIEAHAFFGSEEAYDQYHIGVMRIANDASLSKVQKENRIAALTAQLPPSLVKNMNASQQYDALQKKTEELRSRGGSAQELFAMRAALVGTEAAERLAKLDSENADWHQRLDNYLNARMQIKAKTPGISDQQQAIIALRNQTFSTAEERIRAQTYESMRDHGDNRSF
ncbi:MAG: lipase chaperone [Rubrivivax sp.]|nr:MAG: lipase chaperone [Rubrivivax sp.]